MLIKYATVLVISIFFSSCLEVDSTIKLNENGTGQFNLRYTISAEFLFITPGAEMSGYNYLPADEAVFRARVQEIPGLLILSYQSLESIAGVEITSEMSFSDTNDIESFFNTFNEKPIISINVDDPGLFHLSINPPFTTPVDNETQNLISSLYTNNLIKIIAIVPGIVTESSAGLLSDDLGSAEMELKLTNFLKITEPVEWLLEYTIN